MYSCGLLAASSREDDSDKGAFFGTDTGDECRCCSFSFGIIWEDEGDLGSTGLPPDDETSELDAATTADDEGNMFS